MLGQSKLFSLAVMIAVLTAPAPSSAQFDFEREPINYETAPVRDRVKQLQEQVEAGAVNLRWDEKHGWLPALLEHLKTPQSSQVLVFSKTSQQLQRISPQRPRALYFSDDTYVGWVQAGDFVELSAVDPRQGAIFYTVAQQESEAPEFRRDQGQCIICHGSSKTQGVPGYLVRSVYPGADGHPLFRLGTTTTDHSTPFKQRYGGWYVTGTHGAMRHRGNTIAVQDQRNPIDPEAGANCTSLEGVVRTDAYLRPGSDIVALMVLEHQAKMHNMITRASFIARQTIHQQQIMNEALDRPSDYLNDSAQRRINDATEELLQYMLFCDEFELESPVRGATDFAAEFERRGPFDSQGRSLREFDLNNKLFKYPCSFLVYSESVDQLPPVVLDRLDARLCEVLKGNDRSPEFANLSDAQRNAIREILAETLPRLRGKLGV